MCLILPRAAFRRAAELAVDYVKQIAIEVPHGDAAILRDNLEKCASTSMNSKLISGEKYVFSLFFLLLACKCRLCARF